MSNQSYPGTAHKKGVNDQNFEKSVTHLDGCHVPDPDSRVERIYYCSSRALELLRNINS